MLVIWLKAEQRALQMAYNSVSIPVRGKYNEVLSWTDQHSGQKAPKGNETN